ncbi:hypothetical protein CHL76_12880 [Marinococcus halophilus]|uniref:Uncharacterized protein n=1 Tax=Marinococcus halophilus TaxID=1371 RepID=A0A510Y839_MARHA|nr:hypothetical protein [Marinococcus halophilus]OZT79451.1 hypothetical protein CHL76_12880 [Marinococcus halophilus]GEK59534.1 hypothetical protein MHA01_24390 [Marinococcus halophilus]
MTAGLLLSAVPPKGAPFVMIATDSKGASLEGGPADEKAQKVFNAGNALLAVSGVATDDHRSRLVDILASHKKLPINEKMQLIFDKSLDRKKELGLNMTAAVMQFDESGNPQVAFCHVGTDEGDRQFDPHTFDRRVPEVNHAYFGEDKEGVIEFRKKLDEKLDKKAITPDQVRESAGWFIRRASEAFPEAVNGRVQTKIKVFRPGM